MRNNEEFKKLVDDKLAKMQRHQATMRRKYTSWAAGLLVCIMMFTVFATNSGFFNVFQNDGYVAEDKAHSNGIVDETQEESKNNEIDFIPDQSEEKEDGSTGDDNDRYDEPNVNDESQPDETPDGNPDDTPEPVPPVNDDYVITPDDIFVNEGYVDIMDSLFGDSYNSGGEDISQDSSEDVDSEVGNDNEEYEDVPDGSESENTPLPPDDTITDKETLSGINDFGYNVFASMYESGKNNVLSPISVSYILSCIANGAGNETHEQLIDALGSEDIKSINRVFKNLKDRLQADADASLDGAVWFDGDLSIDVDFLKTVYQCYGLDAFKTHFSSSLAEAIDAWYNGALNEVLSGIERSAKCIFATDFKLAVKWRNRVKLLDEKQGFMQSNGFVTEVDMITGMVNFSFENIDCEGVVIGLEYGLSMVVLLPNDGIALEDIIDKLDSDYFKQMYLDGDYGSCGFMMPTFTIEAEGNIAESLKNMKFSNAFDKDGDFGRITNSDIYISQILNHTEISVNENGISNGDEAYTNTEFQPDYSRLFIANSPFVYMVIDNYTLTPLYLGTVECFE
ncbi:MAG: hypothetical protein IKK70_04965 [Clostridia bacterium]|nr:hypothetical protein [Clostridia bacterium]